MLDIRVTQIVEADAGQSRVLEQSFHVGIGAAGIDGILRLYRIREYPQPDGVRLAPPQDIDYTVRQDDGTHTLIGLRLADSVRTLSLAVKGAAHFQCTSIPIEVVPLQTADLTAPQAGHQLDLKEVTPHVILLHHFKEGIQLRSCQDALGLVVGLGRGRTLGGVLGNDVCLYRVFHRAVHHEVNVTDRGVGELIVHLRVLTDAPVLFQAAVHPLNILLGDERHLLVAQLRLDVEFDVAAVVGEGAGAYRALFVLCEPAIQPLGVQREGRIGVAQDAGQCLGIHAADEGVGGESCRTQRFPPANPLCPAVAAPACAPVFPIGASAPERPRRIAARLPAWAVLSRICDAALAGCRT